MTKIAIQPNASGTGTFTIAAPNSNTDRTFSLPDATGEVYTSGNILGTVSQSGGVPTGAIIERGSNANGEFVKYADGTMVCTRTITVGGLAAAAIITPGTGGGFRTAQNTLNFPATFSPGIPATSASVTNNFVNLWARCFAATAAAWAVTLQTSVNSISSPPTDMTIELTAIGRWF